MKTRNEGMAKVICNKGFSNDLRILSHIKFCISGLESSPQSLTAHSLNRQPVQKLYFRKK
jgi:hypothetical protein